MKTGEYQGAIIKYIRRGAFLPYGYKLVASAKTINSLSLLWLPWKSDLIGSDSTGE
jgi:hypothetical protein